MFWPNETVFIKYGLIENIIQAIYKVLIGTSIKDILDSNLKYYDSGVEYPSDYNGINLDDEKLTGGFGFELHHGGKFLHFRNACGWHNQFVTQDSDKTNLLFHFYLDIVISGVRLPWAVSQNYWRGGS